MLSPKWSEALAALQGHEPEGISWKYTGVHDPKPIANLLQSNEEIPQYVRTTLGRLLAPPSSYIGGRLQYRKPTKRAKLTRSSSSKERKAKIYIAEQMNTGQKFQSAVDMAAEKFHMSESWARNLDKDIVENELRRLMSKLDPGTLQP